MLTAGRFEDARPHYRYLALAGIDAWYNLGLASLRLADYENAIEAFEQALKNNPDDWDARYYVASSYLHANRLEEALKAHQYFLQQEPGNAAILGDLGVVLSRLGRLEEAIEYHNRSLMLRPSLASYYNLGMDLLATKRPDAAAEAFRRALSMNPTPSTLPSSSHVRAALAMALNECGKPEQAIELLESEGGPVDNAELAALTEVLVDIQRFDEAVASATRGIRNAPRDSRAHAQLGWVLLCAGRPTEAREEVGTARELDADSVWYEALEAATLSALGQHAEALRVFDRVTAKQPDLFEDSVLEKYWRQSLKASKASE